MNQAYNDGFKAGNSDKLLGITNEYAIFGINDKPGYSFEYACGYRKGNLSG